ncbi:MAG: hypothetical protein P1V97_31035, partial [Planctomycetota bacterium]|nr:hypothetical protein [Planctomycetota bacterium]
LLAIVFIIAMPGTGIYTALLPLGVVGCAMGAFVMLVLDVPMYFRRRREAIQSGERVLGILAGLRDATTRRKSTGDWSVWKQEVSWMTPYFSACVWLSIAAVWL